MIVRNVFDEAPPETDIGVFEPTDEIALQGALSIAKALQSKKEFTNVYKMTI